MRGILTFAPLTDSRGIGYQTAINEALRAALTETDDRPVSAESLRSILREELAGGGKE